MGVRVVHRYPIVVSFDVTINLQDTASSGDIQEDLRLLLNPDRGMCHNIN